MQFVRFSIVVLVLACLAVLPLAAQTTFATITGIVNDSAGGVVPGAAVEATHVKSNYKYNTVTNQVGAYTLAQLREGEYVLRIEMPGFKEFVVQNIQLVANDLRRIDVRLEIGQPETTIEVSAGATLIETETARISDAKDAYSIKVLPLNTRDLWTYLSLTPGVVQAGAGSSTRRFAGSRANQSDASIDGITVSNGQDGTQISPLVSYVDSFQEFRVDMANNTAEYGSIGQVTIISKSGSNEFHGSVFDYYQTPFFRARNPFASERGSGVRHWPGVAAGGPVVIPGLYNGRDRTFFFGSFETSRGSVVQQLLNPTVPLASWRAGDFSDQQPGSIRDPFTGTAFAGNRIPDSMINPVSKKIQDRFYPVPNFGDTSRLVSQNYRELKSRSFDPATYYTIRGDHRFTPNSFLLARWTWNRGHSRDYEANLPTIGQRWQTRDTRNFNASYTHTLSSTMINEARFGITYNDNPRNGPLLGKEVVSELGLVGLADNLPDINGVLNVSFSGLGLTSITQTEWRHPGFLNFVHQYQDQFSWTHGRHNVKAGLLVNRVRFSDDQASANLFGNVNFSNRFTGHPYADFLLGIPTTSSRAFPPIRVDRVRWGYDLFVTDDFKFRPNLTINVGLRWELHPTWIESNGLTAIFDVDSGKIVIPDGTSGNISPLMPRGYVDVVEASQAGYPGKGLVDTDLNNVAPRIGIAYRPWGNSTVLRAGYGIFYDIIPRSLGGGNAPVPFLVNEPQFTNPANAPTVIFPRVYPASSGGPATVTIPNGVRRDLRTPYSMQYNFTIEHQRWSTGFRASYISTNTRQGEWGYNINQPLPDARRYIDKPRLFPNYPVINYFTNGAGHQYHSMTLEMDRRFAKGLAYQLSWVWARDIGDLERAETPENAYDRGRERSVWLDIPTHRVTGYMIYELPFGKGQRYLSGAHPVVTAIAGGWDISTVYQYYSGQFLTPTWTGPDPTGTAFTSSGTPATVTIRPNQLHDPNLPSDERTTSRWFDPTAFAAPTPGFYGSSAKGVIIGPGSNIVDVGFGKSFFLGESIRLRADLTATNFFNHPNWANPNTSITSAAQVGVISGVGGVSNLDASGPRAFRASLRLEW